MSKNTSLITSKLLTKIDVGVAELRVKNIQQEIQFYVNLVGLDILEELENIVTLGYQHTEILRLIHTTNLEREKEGSAGLYHLAILFKSRSSLAQAVTRIITQSPHSYSGSADHLVSEAFYFSDPEGNGVELYYDKNARLWQWIDGQIVMSSYYIDPYEYIADNAELDGNLAKVLGHIHLKVGSIDKAKEFYTNTIGMTITHEMPTALFLSDGEYHHHLGLNIWESSGADVRTETLGLHSFSMIITDSSEFKYLKERLSTRETVFTEDEKGLQIADPWNNTILISLKENSN